MSLTRAQLDAWLKDLRDPANAKLQGSGFLRTPEDKFCCLGRLANCLDPTGWENVDPTAPSRWLHRKLGRGVIGQPYGHDMFVDPDLIPFDAQASLAVLNDRNASFSHIADKIEQMVAEGRIKVIG